MNKRGEYNGKNINKYAIIVRIICYILIPICGFVMLQSIISLAFFSREKNKQKADSYFETQRFENLYKNSILSNVEANYSKVKDANGKEILTDLNEDIEFKTENGYIYYKTYLENRNFKFLIIDNKTNKAITNLTQTMRTDSVDKIKEELSKNSYYWNYENREVRTNISNLSIEDIKYVDHYKTLEENYDCTIYTSINEDVTQFHDDYYNLYITYKICTNSVKTAIINIIITLVLIIVSAILITIYAGRKRNFKEIQLESIDKIPLEIILAAMFIPFIMLLFLGIELSYNLNITTIIGNIGILIIMYSIALILYESIVRRVKTNTILKNTIIYRLCKWIKNGVKNIFNNFSLAAKIIVILACMLIFTLIFSNWGFTGIILLIAMYVFAFKYYFDNITKFLNIKNTVKKIYEGDTKVRLQEDEYTGVLKELCIYVNDIAGGFTNAIDKSLKSERMKTELITNVSHDIKTPLTSIINYVDLLKKEDIQNEKAKEYLDILEQKSQRLKRLTEDLIEASKASSGNIKLDMKKINVNELIKQISGEFEDKFKNKNLDLNIEMPKEDVFILADSRYLYRVMENMYTNIEKYAMENSRVYVDLLEENKKVKIEIKNISKEKLNISANELMERFVRGESSRNTEGSGLGLSIAQSLTKLQKGEFGIYLDGDLFKVIISFNKEK